MKTALCKPESRPGSAPVPKDRPNPLFEASVTNSMIPSLFRYFFDHIQNHRILFVKKQIILK